MNGGETDRAGEFFPRRVRDSLHADDSVLALPHPHVLEIALACGDWPVGGESATPEQLLRRAGVLVKTLQDAAAAVADKRFSPDSRYPNGPCRFKRSRNLIVAFHGDSPVWFWERTGAEWELHGMRAHFGAAECEPLWDASVLGEYTDYGWPQGNDPSRLTPRALFGVIGYFRDILKRAAARVAERPVLPDVTNPHGRHHFRTDGTAAVAYREADAEPVWCWSRKEDGHWRLYRTVLHYRSVHEDLADEEELHDGDW